jgi:predicted metal-dependent HD superfamily phosphohydrolase
VSKRHHFRIVLSHLFKWQKIDKYYHLVTLYRGTLSILYHYIKATSLIMLQCDDHVNSENQKFVRSGIWTHAFIEDQNTATSTALYLLLK